MREIVENDTITVTYIHIGFFCYTRTLHIITCKHKMPVPGPKRSLTTDCDEPESKQALSSDTPSHTVTESSLANKSAQECSVNSTSTSTTILAVG